MKRSPSAARMACTALLSLMPALNAWAQADVAASQPPSRQVRIGWMSRGGPSPNDASMEAFRLGMRELGYAEGQRYVIEPRYANGHSELMPEQAADLERSGVDLILIGPYEAAVAAKQATIRVPIVITPSVDPSATGVIHNLAHPEGHITGITEMTPDLTPQRLRLLKQIAPDLHRVGILWKPGTLTPEGFARALKTTQATGHALGVQVQAFEAQGEADFDQAFAAMASAHVDGLIVLTNPVFGMQRQQIQAHAAALKLPVAYEWRSYVQGGGLISYGADVPDIYRRAAGQADKIIRGVKPSDIPVEAPRRIELTINLKAAKVLGLTVPPEIVQQAAAVIE